MGRVVQWATQRIDRGTKRPSPHCPLNLPLVSARTHLYKYAVQKYISHLCAHSPVINTLGNQSSISPFDPTALYKSCQTLFYIKTRDNNKCLTTNIHKMTISFYTVFVRTTTNIKFLNKAIIIT